MTVWVYKYSYFAGTTLSDTAVNSKYVVLNDGSDLIGWADEECTKEYAYICEFTGRSRCRMELLPALGLLAMMAAISKQLDATACTDAANEPVAGPAWTLLAGSDHCFAGRCLSAAVSCAWTAPPPSAG